MGACSSSLDNDLRRIEQQETEQKRIDQQRIKQSAQWVVRVDAGQGASMELQIRQLETVGTLRQRAAQELGLPEEELELVLAGDVLAEMAATAESVAICDVSWEFGRGVVELRGELERWAASHSPLPSSFNSAQTDSILERLEALGYAGEDD